MSTHFPPMPLGNFLMFGQMTSDVENVAEEAEKAETDTRPQFRHVNRPGVWKQHAGVGRASAINLILSINKR